MTGAIGNWYFVVGLFVAGLTGYILSVKFPNDAGWTVVVAWGMIAFWPFPIALAILLTPVALGVLVGKTLLRLYCVYGARVIALFR